MFFLVTLYSPNPIHYLYSYVFTSMLHVIRLAIGYEPTTLNVHPPPPITAEGGFIFFVEVSSVPKKKCPQGKA